MLQQVIGLSILLIFHVRSDTIADCRYEDFHGHWAIHVYEYNKDCNHDKNPEVLHTSRVHFEYPNIVKNPIGQLGHWTMIDNEGAELTINERTYLLMNWFNTTHYSCQMTIGHWTYSTTNKEWFCAKAYKLDVNIEFHPKKPTSGYGDELFRFNRETIDEINSKQNSWKAQVYPEFEGYRNKDIERIMGKTGGVPRQISKMQKRELTQLDLMKFRDLPQNFDWRKILHPSGKSYVSPVRNQERCGSCYAFASMGAAEARLRIVSNMTDTTIFSPQDIVECSKYSQGCEGGYAYLTFGKYAQDFGLVPEECNPYKGQDKDYCSTKKDCKRYYFSGYHYLGGYDGAMNEEYMKLELIENGPFPVAINVTHDFLAYKEGIYVQPKGFRDFNPYKPSNHAVLLVGYGYEEDLRMPYWVVKNSWSEKWGESGYFRIRRGTDELAIESLGVSSSLIYF